MRSLDGRKHFVQWDMNRKITAENLKIGDEIHFDNGTTSNALVLTAKQDGENIIVDVPNTLLTFPFPIKIYRYIEDESGSYTKETTIFSVEPRKKPDDYVYTPTEVWSYEELEKRVANLEEGGSGGGTGGSIIVDIKDGILNIEAIGGSGGGSGEAGFSPTVKITPIENGHRVTITDINGDHSYEVFNGKDGKDGVDGKDGKDYVLTEADKNDIAKLVRANFVDVSEVGQ